MSTARIWNMAKRERATGCQLKEAVKLISYNHTVDTGLAGIAKNHGIAHAPTYIPI